MAVWLIPVPVAAAGAATEFGQDSGTQSGLPRHRGSTAVAFCLTAVSVPEIMELLLPHNQNTEDGLGDMGVVVPWPWVVAVWPRVGQLRRRQRGRWMLGSRYYVAGWGSKRRSRRGSRRLGSYPLVSLGQLFIIIINR